MSKILSSSLIFCILLNFNTFAQKSSTKKTVAIFNQYCSTCHGEKIEAFVDRKWAHGNNRNDIIKIINEGYLSGGMPSWKNTIKPKDIEAIADLILVSIKNVEQYKFTKGPKTNIFESGKMKIKLDTVASGFDSPWGLTQLPSGDLLVTDRSGFLYKIGKDKSKIAIKNIPKPLVKGQGGLLDVEIHPDYKNNAWVYLSYSKFKVENGENLTTTAVVRGKIVDNDFVDQQEIFEAKPYTNTTHHYGNRLVFDKKGYLYITVGDRGKHFEYAQSKDNDLGKVHRIHDDGRIPSDNPFLEPESKTAYTWGNRNSQGMAMDPITGLIWENEHGPRGGDEINIVKKGANYGWPAISYGINYDGKPITNASKKEGMEQPASYYIPSIAPSGMAFVSSDLYPSWKGNILIGSLRYNYLERVVIKDNKVVSNHKELLNIGRMRNVKQGSDGYLYIGVENPGLVLKLVPIK